MELAKQHDESGNFSILMFPWLAHGHVFPFLELAKNLSKKNFKIYFCSTPINLTSIKDSLDLEKISSNHNNIELVELHLPSIFPDLPPHYHTTKNVPPHLLPKLLQAFRMSKSSFWEIISTLKPDLLIYDAHQLWAPKQALSLGIPAVHFGSGATSPSFYHHLFLHKDDNLPFPYKEIYLRGHEIKAIQELGDVYLKDNTDEDFGHGHITLSCELILLKSCRAMEGKYIDHLSLLSNKKVVPVGALVVTQAAAIDHHKHNSEKIIMEWLSEKKNNSTVFICFGSEAYLSKDEVEEIAKGLELCDDEINFIWAIRFPAGEKVSLEEALPMGFLEKVKERGMAVEGWVPQTKILSHPSIGAFVSHCGMNSTLESIYFGVPIVAMPLKNIDQPVIARLLVEIGIGMEIVKDDTNGHLKREEVAKTINEVVLGRNGIYMRLKVAELSNKMKSEEEEAMDEAAEELRRLCIKYKK